MIDPIYVDKYFENISSDGHIGGQNFENYYRNLRLLSTTSKDNKLDIIENNEKLIDLSSIEDLPFDTKVTKTGTTIVGVKCPDAVILAADTRATEGSIVATKNCKKLHHITDHIYCAGAGVGADLDHTTLWLENNAELYALNSKRKIRVANCAVMLIHELFRYMGYKQCAIIMGGWDPTGTHLFTIHPHGSYDKLPFSTMGSGSLSAMAVLESKYMDNMSVNDATNLAVEAITAGILNDLGSGSNVDVVIMSKSGSKMIRSCSKPGVRMFSAPSYKFPIGCTTVLSESIEVIEDSIDDQVME